MIRDKRKISPTSGTGDKPAESKESNGSGADASEPEAQAEAVSAPEAAAASGQPGAASGGASSGAAPAGQVTAEKTAADKAASEKAASESKVKSTEESKAKPAEEEAEQPEAVATAVAEPTVEAAELGQLRSALDERTADLQRITAEYANYRKRVERDRAMAGELAVAMVLTEVLTVLDDIDRARDHGDLTGPFAAVADKLTTVTAKLGLTAFGAKGDAFDPNRHEAVAHQTSSEVTESTCIDVMRRGYLLGERLLRPALVAVADPESE